MLHFYIDEAVPSDTIYNQAWYCHALNYYRCTVDLCTTRHDYATLY